MNKQEAKSQIQKLVEKYERLAEAEKINITPDALKEIALSAEGSLRDAESFLDQIISLGYKQIDLNTLEEVLGRVNFSKTAQFLDYLLAKDVKSAITFINSLYENGVDLINFSRTVLKLARQIMLLKINPQISQIIKDEFTEDQLEKVNQLAQDFPMDDLQKLIDSLLKIKEQIKYSPIQTLPLEMVVIQLCSKNS